MRGLGERKECSDSRELGNVAEGFNSLNHSFEMEMGGEWKRGDEGL